MWPLTPWMVALICHAPFLRGRRLIAGVLLLLASLASWVAPWLLIDAAGAILFALFTQWQAKAIALVFVAMFAADLGADPWTMGMALGWVQLGLLALWTHDELKPYPGERVYL